MDSPTRPLRTQQRILCVNCNICVNACNTSSRYLVLQLDSRVVSLLSNWISPVIITEEDYICEACFNLSMQIVNAQLHENDGIDRSAGPSHRGHTQVCLVCGRSLVNRQSHLILRRSPSDLTQRVIQIITNRVAPQQVTPSDRTCHACWMHVTRVAVRNIEADERRPELQEQDSDDEPPVDPEDPVVSHDPHDLSSRPVSQDSQDNQQNREMPDNITLRNYRRGPNTASHCIFDGCDRVTNLHTISDPLRVTILHNYNYYIPILARICSDHLTQNNWDSLYNAANSLSTFTAEQVEHVFSFVNPIKQFLDFTNLQSVEQMDDHLFGYWLGMTKQNFMCLVRDLPRVLETPRGLLGLGALLIKMRTGDSDERISTILQVPRVTLERLMAKIRELLLQDFVPRNLGLNHLRREEILLHNLTIPNGIYNENNVQVIVKFDGTYIYLNKSGNYTFQKESYSLHKYRNLLKPFMLVLCDGYILDCFGPYKATTSDAQIMTSLFQNENSPLRQYFQENDVFILDRGFRDSISLLESCNYRTYMPDSLLEGEHQLTTTQANRSRCVTICRWVVEVANGYLKRDYRLLRFDHFNKTVPNMMAYFQIAASLINKFGVRLRDRADASQIVSIIRERMPLANNLSVAVETLNLNRRASFFRSITANDNNVLFPRLEYHDLILFALGTYQIRQARSYYGEHIRFHGGYRIEVCREPFDVEEFNLRGTGENSLIRGKIKSRHVGRRQYYVYILIENNLNGREGIKEYCCNCIVGRRTVGCCAHVMTLVWFLGWARHQANIVPLAAFLDDVVVREDLE